MVNRALVAVAVALALASGCAHQSARIPVKAAADLGCPAASISVEEMGGGDSGQHLVKGCGKKAVYELNPIGDWVLNAPPTVDPSYISPQTPEH